MLHFDPKTGLYPDDVTTVREGVRSDWVTAFRKDGQPELDTEPETPAGQLIDSQTAAIVDKDSEVLFLGNQFNPLTAQGIWQDALAKIYFLTRKVQQSSIAVCTVTGLQGTVIPVGSVIKSTADETEWIAIDNVTIPASGTATMQFQSLDTGALEAAANTLTQIVTVTPGWDSVTNPTAATVGRVEETQAEFEARRYASVAKNARGSVSALYGALADLPGVVDRVVLENVGPDPVTKWGVSVPGHGVYISIVGGTDAEIAETIYRKKSAGCDTGGNTAATYIPDDLPANPVYEYHFERPAPLSFGVKVTIRQNDALASDIEDLVKDAILADFEGNGPHGNLRVGMAQIVYASRFYCAALNGANAIGLESIEICAPAIDAAWADSVTVNADQEPVLDRNDIIVDIVGD